MSIHIRPATPDDALRLGPLAIMTWLHTYGANGVSASMARYVLENFTPQQFKRYLTDPTRAFWVIEDGESLHGYMAVDLGTPHLQWGTELQTLYLQPHLARRGIGRRCLQLAQAQAQHHHECDAIWLTVNAQNHQAIAFYQHCGLRQVGETDFMLEDVAHRNLILSSAA